MQVPVIPWSVHEVTAVVDAGFGRQQSWSFAQTFETVFFEAQVESAAWQTPV